MAFIGSTAFVVSGAVGLLLAGGFLAAPVLFPDLVSDVASPCDAKGTPLTPASTDETDHRRASEYRLSAPRDGAEVELCVGVGSIDILPHDAADVSVQVVVESKGSGAAARVADTVVQVSQDAGGIRVLQTEAARAVWWFGGEGADVSVTVFVPRGLDAAYDARVDVGSIAGQGLRGMGPQEWRVDVGDIDVHYAAIAAGQLRGVADVGDVRFDMPTGPGYRVDAATDVGDVSLELPGLRIVSYDEDPAGDHVIAETEGYARAGTKVQLDLRVDVGDVTVS
ncbi:MAG: hypothetical protein ACPGQL_05485 [Thermoplasmatota archaeon]